MITLADTVQVIDVFAMPQSGTTVTVESVDDVFQQKMMEMLKQTGRYVLTLCVLLTPDVVPLSLGQRWSWVGITLTQALGVGYPAWISILNK